MKAADDSDEHACRVAFLDIDIAHGDPDRVLLLLLLWGHTPAGGATAVGCCSTHSHLLHHGHTVREGDVIEVLLKAGITAAVGRRRSMSAGRKEGKVAAVAVLAAGLLLLWTVQLMVAVVGVVAAFSQPYRRGGLVAPAKKRKF